MKKCLLLPALLLGTVASSQAVGTDVRADIARPQSPGIVMGVPASVVLPEPQAFSGPPAIVHGLLCADDSNERARREQAIDANRRAREQAIDANRREREHEENVRDRAAETKRREREQAIDANRREREQAIDAKRREAEHAENVRDRAAEAKRREREKAIDANRREQEKKIDANRREREAGH